MAHPERFMAFRKLVKHQNCYMRPAEGDCSCGTHVILENQYMGACQCPGCGLWYGVHGQRLLPPSLWTDEI